MTHEFISKKVAFRKHRKTNDVFAVILETYGPDSLLFCGFNGSEQLLSALFIQDTDPVENTNKLSEQIASQLRSEPFRYELEILDDLPPDWENMA